MAPIHDACIRGDIDELKRILENSSDSKTLLDTKDENGNNVFVLSLINKQYDIMRYLSRGKSWIELYVSYLNISKHYKLDCTLHDIIANGYHGGYTEEYIIECIQNELLQNSNLETRDCNLNTPLHIACSFRFMDIVKLLLDNGADVNALNRDLEQPLHVLCNTNSEDTPEVFKNILSLLIEKGANVNAINIHNQTPCDILFDSYHDDISELQKEFTKSMINNMLNFKKSLEYTKKENIITPQVQELLIHASIAMKQLEYMKNN